MSFTSTDHHIQLKLFVLQQQRPENVVPDTSKLNKRNVSPVKEQTNALKDSRASRQTSLCSHPSSMERMRCKTEDSLTHTSELHNSHKTPLTSIDIC